MIVNKVFNLLCLSYTTYLSFCAGKPAKKEPPSIKKKVAAEGKGPGKAGKATTANNSAAGGGGKARTPSGGGNRKHQAPQPDRNELLKSLM